MPAKTCPQCGFFNSNATKHCKRCGAEIPMESNAQFLKIKKTLADKYIITGEIGHGGMAVVYKAVQKNLDRVVAIKVIRENLLHDQDSVRQFHEEARLAGALNHPNIITIYDEGETSGVHYIVMEYLEGRDLHSMIRSNQIPDEKSLKRYFIQIASALQYLGDLQLIHRDIKSSNIFISITGRAILMDFGISALKNRLSSTTEWSICGTPEYMSPEHINGFNTDERTDLYSLGVVMYECFTGILPYKGSNQSETLNKILNQEATPPRSINKKISRSVNQIILKLLNKNPDRRYQNGVELMVDLENKKLYTFSTKAPIDLHKVNKLLLFSIIPLLVILSVSIFFTLYPPGQSTKASKKTHDTSIIPAAESETNSESIEIPAAVEVTPVFIYNDKNAQPENQHRTNRHNETSVDDSGSESETIDVANRLLDDGMINNSKEMIIEARKKFQEAADKNKDDSYSRELIRYCDSLTTSMPK